MDNSVETPICLSQYFVNKQNVRSYKNLVKIDLTTAEDIKFIQHIFENGAHLMNYLNDEFLSLLRTLKANTRERSREDFKIIIPADKNPILQAVSKELIFDNCWKILNEIIPRVLFNSNSNAKVFRNLILAIVYSMRRQHIMLTKLIEKWDFTVSPWLRIPIVESKKILYHILLWVVKNILSPIVCLNFYVTTCKIDADENKLHYFWKSQWQSFYDKKISDMMFTRVINKCEPLSMGKKLKRNHSVAERLRRKNLKKDIPKLHLVLKTNNDCRPIVRYKNDAQSPAEKYKMKERLKMLKILTYRPPVKIESQYKELHRKWLSANKPKLYFVKSDLSNAFGSVNKEKLIRILSERHMQFQKSEKNIDLKKRMAQQYKEMLAELRRPLLVRAGSTVFEWKDGLVQGYKYSPALSELYYAHLDELYFYEHLKKSDAKMMLFTRVVDDYLYITDSFDDAHSFLNALSKYRNVNYNKTVVNFEHPHIKYSEEITFLGYSYNTEKLEVSRANNVFVGQICYKIAFTGATANVQKFVENRVGQSGIQINGHIFNFLHNPEDLIWRHIFTTFCLSANKLCTILAILCDEKEMLNYLVLYKKKVVVKMSNSILETLLRNGPADLQFIHCNNHFRYLSWKALYLCAKGTPKCSSLIPTVNIELAKTNCLFGKWRDHASAISSNGEPYKAAVKEICRNPNLRALVKTFEHLPKGFECYNHRKSK